MVGIVGNIADSVVEADGSLRLPPLVPITQVVVVFSVEILIGGEFGVDLGLGEGRGYGVVFANGGVNVRRELAKGVGCC